MNNLSIANKYRPEIYDDVLGQEAVVKALKGKIKDNRLPRVSLYCGAHGGGKTTVARITAKAVNCLSPLEDGNPCCQCESCKSIDNGVSPDVIELDAASHNKVEDAEGIIRQSNFLPVNSSGKKVFILDEFHMMTKEAQNKLLKQVEEPPAHVMFIFCTTEENRVIPTILSRCNKFTFKSISEMDILENLKNICEKEKFDYEEDALKLIAKSSEGHVRDSLSVLEQLSYEKLTTSRVADTLGLATDEQVFRILDSVARKDMKEMLSELEAVISKGNLASFLKEVVRILCYLCIYDSNVEDAETTEFRAYCSKLKEQLPVSLCVEYINTITGCLRDNRGLGLDLATRLCFLTMVQKGNEQDEIGKLREEVSVLREKLELVGSMSQVSRQTPQPVVVAEEPVGSVDASLECSSEGSNVPPVPSVPSALPPMPPVCENTQGSGEEGWEPVSNLCPFKVEDMPEEMDESELEVVPFETVSNVPFETVGVGSTIGVPPIPSVSTSTTEEKSVSPVPFAIPGGTVHPKEEVKEVVKEVVKEEKEEEVPVVDESISPMGFSDVGSLGGGLFGSFGARLF